MLSRDETRQLPYGTNLARSIDETDIPLGGAVEFHDFANIESSLEFGPHIGL